jgi:hypothetical protein
MLINDLKDVVKVFLLVAKDLIKYCSFCHCNNHEVEFCYDKHGHPNVNKGSSYVNASNVEEDASSNGNFEVCVSSIPSANIAQDKYDQLIALLQQVNLLPSASASTSTPSSSTNQISYVFPSLDPNSGIICILSCSWQTHSNYWLLDSGATDHVCSSMHWFTSFYRIKPIHIILPTGSSVLVEYVGNVFLSNQFYLTHVLYLPC